MNLDDIRALEAAMYARESAEILEERLAERSGQVTPVVPEQMPCGERILPDEPWVCLLPAGHEGKHSLAPEQPVEPAPPNRWKAFSDEELDDLRMGMYAGGNETSVDTLHDEIEAEQTRRRIQQ